MDILRARYVDAAPPPFAERRGWTPFLASLTDDALDDCERRGLAAHLETRADAPATLVELAASARAVGDLAPPLPAPPGDPSRAQNVKARKQIQLDALLHALRPMALDAARVVELGSGSGHLTRLAAAFFSCDALGLERDPARVTFAESLAAGTRARFELRDALANPFAMRADDLAVGLHACGALGDGLVRAAAEAGAAVALVSCCLQKIPGPARAPLSTRAAKAGMTFEREFLGLSNVTERGMGVEASHAENLASREARFALARLLRARGVHVDPGEAMRGLNRRSAHRGFAELAKAACASRALAAPLERELRAHALAAREEFARVRRFSLPRVMLARALELAVVLDRATALEERGYEARVRRVFDAQVSPRNLGIFGRRG